MRRQIVTVSRTHPHGFGFEMVAVPDKTGAGEAREVAIVSNVFEGGPAEGLLQPRDRIVACNDQAELPAFEPDRRLIQTLRLSSTACLTIERPPMPRIPVSNPLPLPLDWSEVASLEVSFAVRSRGSPPSMLIPPKVISGINGVSVDVTNPNGLLSLLGVANEVAIDFSTKAGPARTYNLFPGPDGSLGFRLIGGNVSGVYIADVLPGKAAALAGIQVNDRLLAVNEINVSSGATKEAALLALMMSGGSSGGQAAGIRLTLASDKVGLDRLISGEVPGDLFYVLARVDLPGRDSNEFGIRAGDILRVVNSLAGGRVGNWEAVRVYSNSNPPTHGHIPNKDRADQLAMSLGLRPPAYSSVVFRRPVAPRPVVLVGPLAEQAWDCLVQEPGVNFSVEVAKSKKASRAAAAAIAAAAMAGTAPPIVVFVGERDAGLLRGRKSNLFSAFVSLNNPDHRVVMLTGTLAVVRRCQEEPVWLPVDINPSCYSSQQALDCHFNCGMDLPPAHFKEETERRLHWPSTNEGVSEANYDVQESQSLDPEVKAVMLQSRSLGQFDSSGGCLLCSVSGAALEVPPGAIQPGLGPVTLQFAALDGWQLGPLVLVGPTDMTFQLPVRLRNLPIAWSGCTAAAGGNGRGGGDGTSSGGLRIFSTPLVAATSGEGDWTELAWTSDLIDRRSDSFSISMKKFSP